MLNQYLPNAQSEFGQPTLAPTYLEDKTEVKVSLIEANCGIAWHFLQISKQ